jgi:outer membrane lipoprotein-sorting protein
MKRYAMLIASLWAASALVTPSAALAEETADSILSKVDANMSFESMSYSGRMEISIGGETRYKTMESLALGSDKAFAEFTNPEDRGTRFLKLGKELWMYFPKEQDTVKISGHLLKEGMMGSDVSYEDALESKDFRAKYSAALKGKDEVEGRASYVVELTAKVPTAAYDRRVLWVDSERFITLKEEMYARSGRLLKTSRTIKAAQVGERWYPAKTEFVSRLRSNTKTVFEMTRIEIDVPVDPKRFTMAALTK